MALGNSLFFDGEYPAAWFALENGIALYKRQQHPASAMFQVRDPGVVCYSVYAFVLWKLGYPERALRSSQDALTLARERSHPLTLAFALYQAATLHQFRGESHQVSELASAALTLTTAHELGPWMLGQVSTVLG